MEREGRMPNLTGSGEEDPHPTVHRERDPFDATVARSLSFILPVLALLYSVLAGTHLYLLPSSQSVVLAPIAGGSALVLAAGWSVLRRWGVPPGMGHAVGALAAGVVLVNSLIHLAATGDPMQTTNLILLVLGVGVLFLDLSWFGIVVSVTFLGWLWVAGRFAPSDEWVHFGFSLALATVLAGTVLVVRSRSLRHIHELRREERLSQLELESALEQTERARKGEEEARRAVEEAVVEVKESEERFRRLADATFEAVLILAGSQVVDANSRASVVLGQGLDEVVGRSVEEWIPPDQVEPFRALLTEARKSGRRATSRELEGLRGDGSRFPMEVSALAAGHRGTPGHVLAIRDITDEKRAESLLRQALEEAEANARAKNAFLANMSHELRTPLNAVIGFANILLKKAGERMETRERDYVERIVVNGEHLLALINDILDLSKIGAQRLEVLREPVDLEELFSEVLATVEIQANRKGLTLAADVPPGLKPVVTDRRRLQQVLLNLVGNAVKFTEEGSVTVRVEAGGRDGISPARIQVKDTGVGIPREKLGEIFLPFHQIDESAARSFGGTGLGLAISRSLCELMGYDLSVESRGGEGSTFTIDLKPVKTQGPSARSAMRGGVANPSSERPGS